MLNQRELQVRVGKPGIRVVNICIFETPIHCQYKKPILIVCNPINAITPVQYGMSMNFYNKLDGIWIMKVLDIPSQN
jgi:hypothetical protein